MTPADDVDLLVGQLTVEEKARLTAGASAWETAAVERLRIPSIFLADGPHGVRRETAPLVSRPATCFPTQSALGASWDRNLVGRVAHALGAEARAQDVAVLLGPSLAMKRTPLFGRSFENFSEDPLLTGELASAYVRALQAEGVGASLKPFAVNNQETGRHWISVDVDERTFREIYGAATERVIRQSAPWTVMNSYNRVNGEFAAQSTWLMTTILRDAYGYRGTVVSDWGAVHDQVAALVAGTDLDMHFEAGRDTATVIDAVRSGELDETVLDRSVRRILELVAKTSRVERGTPLDAADIAAHHHLAREAAAAGIVLLRNTGVLPLADATDATVAVIGRYAADPRFQGGGSALVDPTRVTTVLDALAERGVAVRYAPGFDLASDVPDDALEDEASAAASGAGSAIVLLGQPDGTESEGYDRTTIDIPDNQLRVLRAVMATGTPTIVVLVGGSVLRVEPWHDEVGALLHAWHGGQAAGGGIVDVLFGAVNPSGRLSETVPRRVQDTPGWVTFPGERGVVRYGEGVFIGYRWYDALDLEVSYPFGHGLSYTAFDYTDLEVGVVDAQAGDVEVAVTVTNTGAVAGAEVVQLYVGDPVATVRRPVRELRGFEKVFLTPGASARVRFTLVSRDFAWFDVVDGLWRREAGAFTISVGASSRDLRGTRSIELPDDPTIPPITSDEALGTRLQGRQVFDPHADHDSKAAA